MEQAEDTTTTEQEVETTPAESATTTAQSIDLEEVYDTAITEQAAEIERLLETMGLMDEQLDMIQDLTVDILSALHITNHDDLVNEVRKLCCDILTTINNG